MSCRIAHYIERFGALSLKFLNMVQSNYLLYRQGLWLGANHLGFACLGWWEDLGDSIISNGTYDVPKGFAPLYAY